MKLGDYLNAINHSKKRLLDTDDEFVEKQYAPYVVNRCLSYFPDTIFHANQMNCIPSMDKKMHFDYLLNIIRKRKRFSKWLKAEGDSSNIEVVKEYYNYSERKAREALKILSASDLKSMREYLSKGGK
mgnify:CR=1 FL=1